MRTLWRVLLAALLLGGTALWLPQAVTTTGAQTAPDQTTVQSPAAEDVDDDGIANDNDDVNDNDDGVDNADDGVNDNDDGIDNDDDGVANDNGDADDDDEDGIENTD